MLEGHAIAGFCVSLTVTVKLHVAPWTAAKALILRFRWPAQEGQRVVFVVTDGTGTRPVQALDLKCS